MFLTAYLYSPYISSKKSGCEVSARQSKAVLAMYDEASTEMEGEIGGM